MKTVWLSFIGMLCLLGTINAQHSEEIPPEQLLHLSHAEQLKLTNAYVAGLDPNSDAEPVYAYIDQLLKASEKHSEPELKYLAWLIEAQFIYYNESIEVADSKLNLLLQKAHQNSAVWLEARLNNMLGHFYFSHVENYELGFEHYARAVDLVKAVDTENFPKKPVYITDLGRAHYRFRDFKEAAKAFQMALQNEDYMSERQLMHTLNNLGLSYRNMNLLDSSDHYFNVIINRLPDPIVDSTWFGISTGNLGVNEFLRKRFDVAKPMLQTDARIAIGLKDWSLACGALTTLGDMALQERDINGAKSYLQEAARLAHLLGSPSRLSKLYPLLAKLEAELGRPLNTSLYFDSAMVLRDSLDRIFNGKMIARVEQRLQAERSRAEIQQAQQLRKVQVMKRNGIIAFLVLGILTSFLIFGRFRLRAKMREQEILAEKESLKHELEVSTLHLNDFVHSLMVKNQLITTLEQKVAEAEENSRKSRLPEGFDINGLRESVILTDKDWNTFRSLFERVHAGFFERLNDKLPGLTQAEIRVMALLRLNMSNREMADTLGISPVSVRSIRSRMRAKLPKDQKDLHLANTI